MSAAKHTPGPWSVGAVRQQRVDERLPRMAEAPIHVGVNENRGNCIAIVYGGGPGGLYSDEEAVLGNSRLIAAAPDLLDALHECVNLLTAIQVSPHHQGDVVALARAAIAKATGGGA